MATTSHTRPMVVSVWAENVEATAHFYRDVVGLEPIRVHEDDVIRLNMTGGFMAILKGKPQAALNSARERWPIFALAVDDFDATLSRLEAHGVALPWGIEGSERYSRWVMIHDPAGNLIELVEDHPAG